MPYTAEISRTNPTCFLFLVDQSGSMKDPFGVGAGKSKAEGVADAVNRLLQTLALRCAKAEGIRDYFHVGVIGYGNQVGPVLGQPAGGVVRTPTVLEGAAPAPATGPGCLMPMSAVADRPLRVESRVRQVDDGAGGLVSHAIKFPVWFEPVANGATPMCEAIDLAWTVLVDFVNRFPHCFPPMLVNITDGEATDGNPEQHAISIYDLASTDGRALFLNLHISSLNQQPILFPDTEAGLADDYAQMLFRMSSPLPPLMRREAQKEGHRVTELARGFAFNADLVSVIKFLDIGTRASQNLR